MLDYRRLLQLELDKDQEHHKPCNINTVRTKDKHRLLKILNKSMLQLEEKKKLFSMLLSQLKKVEIIRMKILDLKQN